MSARTTASTTAARSGKAIASTSGVSGMSTRSRSQSCLAMTAANAAGARASIGLHVDPRWRL